MRGWGIGSRKVLSKVFDTTLAMEVVTVVYDRNNDQSFGLSRMSMAQVQIGDDSDSSCNPCPC